MTASAFALSGGCANEVHLNPADRLVRWLVFSRVMFGIIRCFRINCRRPFSRRAISAQAVETVARAGMKEGIVAAEAFAVEMPSA